MGFGLDCGIVELKNAVFAYLKMVRLEKLDLI